MNLIAILNFLPMILQALARIPTTASGIASASTAIVAGGTMLSSGPITGHDWIIIACAVTGAAINALQIEITRRSSGVSVSDLGDGGGRN